MKSLDDRLRVLLPAEYGETFEDLQPAPMRSAGLKYDADGNVAWDEMWQTYCDLAMAGGPPHKGRLLEPGAYPAIQAEPGADEEVVEEICRGIILATDLDVRRSPLPGWVRVKCLSGEMAGWLLRAITMENVAVRRHGMAIDLPAAPHFRIEKEIKNVVTVIAKTCHYWIGHMPREQKASIADLFATMDAETPPIEPVCAGDGLTAVSRASASRLADALHRDTGLNRTPHDYDGWLGLDCSSVRAAVWMMRAAVAHNALARREETTLFVPVNPMTDPNGQAVARIIAVVHSLALSKGVLQQ